MAAPQFGQPRWADMNSDSDDSVPFLATLAGNASGINRPDDESYILPPVQDLDDSKSGINKQLRTAAKLCPCDTVAEEVKVKDNGKPRTQDNGNVGVQGENINGPQIGVVADFKSFNDTWKPNPDAVHFHPMSMEVVPTATSTEPRKINKKRARRVISAVRAVATSSGGRNSIGSFNFKGSGGGDADSVVESISSMKPRRKRTKKNSVVLDGTTKGEEERVELTPEQLEQRVKTREKDVARWKSTPDYHSYLTVLPKEKRVPDDPATPDPRTSTMTKRQWKFNNEQWQRSIKDRLKFDREFPSL